MRADMAGLWLVFGAFILIFAIFALLSLAIVRDQRKRGAR